MQEHSDANMKCPNHFSFYILFVPNNLQLVVFGTSFCCSFTSCQVHQTELPETHAPIGQIPALNHDANDQVRAGALYIHLYKEI